MEENQKGDNTFKIFELITELIGWLEIMISPTLIGVIIGIIVYLNFPNTTGKVIGISIGILGLLIGVIWATKIFKSKKGTVWFMSRIMATPELDKKENENQN